MLINFKTRNNHTFQQQNSKINCISTKQTKLFIFLLVVSLQLTSVETCYTIKGNTTQCLVCQSQTNIKCYYTNSSDPLIILSPPLCATYCCDANIFNDTSGYSICNKNIDSRTFNFTLFIVILFLGILMIIFLAIFLKKCVQKCKQLNNQSMPQKVDLNAYKLAECGPYYQDRSQNCPICLSNNCNIRTKCGHLYHSQCLITWIKNQFTCPLCKVKQINPILLYCSKCFKQSKIVALLRKMDVIYGKLWKKYQQHKCESCIKNHQDQISINIQPSEQEDGKAKNSKQVMGSQQNILKNL